jgi:hypothetical protein
MVTNNVNDFERVRGLRVEDWSQPAWPRAHAPWFRSQLTPF